MRPEIWELTHRLWGIEISVYDMCIILFNLFMATLAIFCYLIAYCRSKESLKGNFKTNGFISIWDSGNSKAYKVGEQANSMKKKNNAKAVSKISPKEDIACSVCGINLPIGNQIR